MGAALSGDTHDELWCIQQWVVIWIDVGLQSDQQDTGWPGSETGRGAPGCCSGGAAAEKEDKRHRS